MIAQGTNHTVVCNANTNQDGSLSGSLDDQTDGMSRSDMGCVRASNPVTDCVAVHHGPACCS